MSTATNVAAERTRLIGREPELALLTGGHERLVTLVGPPGVGKSRLALAIARRWLEEPGVTGVWWVDAADIRTVTSLTAAVTAVLGLPASGDVGRALDARGGVRLVVDGTEHLEPAARERIGRWLDQAPGLRVLLTSIGRLGLEGERVLEVAPLPLPDAAALFEERASHVGSTALDRREVEALVTQLDRLPLAIELAAARSSVLTPRQLLQRVQAGKPLLEGGRHGSLAAAVAFAWDLLDREEQRALAWCSVFRGGFGIEAAEAVLPPGDALRILARLRDRSMLQRRGDRFTLLESVRAHAADQLDAIGEREQAEARHRAHFLAEGEARARRTESGDDAEVLSWLGGERDNLQAAWERADDPGEAARLALVLHLPLLLQGPIDRSGELLDRSLARVRDGELRARLLRCRAEVHWREGHLDRARASLDEALGLVSGPPVLRGRLLTGSGRLRGAMGDEETARVELREAIAVFRAGGHLFFEGVARNDLGTVEEMAGELSDAAAAFEEALGLFRTCGHRRLEGVACTNLAVVRAAEGRLGVAEELLVRARDLYRRSGARADEAAVHVNLGHVHLGAGRLDEAEEALRTALLVEREIGKHDFEGLAAGNLALVAASRGELRTARTQLHQALDQLRSTGNRHARASFLPFAAALEAALGQVEEARRVFAEAREAIDARPDPVARQTLHVLEGFLDLAGPGTAEERASAAASRLPVGGGADTAVARRLLERALDGFRDGDAARVPPVEADEADEGLEVGPEGAWFAWTGAPVDLTRRGAIRRVLAALVEQRLIAPGTGLSPDRLFTAGWPGDRALPTAADNRVYAAIRTLRALGLEGLLLRRDDGYLLDPQVPLRRAR